MQQEKIKNRRVAVLFWVLTAICFVIIFYFSSRVATDSSEQSSFLLRWLNRILGGEYITEHTLRKIAHITEYCGTGLMMNLAFLFTYGKARPVISAGCVSLYAVTDEVHQYFVEGRSCQISDWAIDSLGAVIASVVVMIIIAIINSVIKKRKNND